MNLKHIILLIVAIVVIYMVYRHFNNREYMTDLPEEIHNLINESGNTTYYSEENNEEENSEEDSEELANSITSVDNNSLPDGSATSVTNETDNNSSIMPIESDVNSSQNASVITNDNANVPKSNNKSCTVQNTENNADEYIRNLVLKGQRYCSNNNCADKDVIRNYRSDFFNFRDKIGDMSRSNDMALNVARLYLEGNNKMTDRVKGRRVKDIYDELTKSHVIRDKNCVREKDVTDVYHQGYFSTQNTPALTRDNWMYSNDKRPKNKVVDSGILGYDPTGVMESSVDVGRQMEQ